jgi:arsenate reductase
VRKDSQFAKLGLDEADYVEAEPVIELLVAKPRLLQRPIVVKGDRAIIGRPKDRVRAFLA